MYTPLKEPRLAVLALLRCIEDCFASHFGIKCSSFSKMNLGTSRRSACSSIGYTVYQSVQLGNILLERTCAVWRRERFVFRFKTIRNGTWYEFTELIQYISICKIRSMTYIRTSIESFESIQWLSEYLILYTSDLLQDMPSGPSIYSPRWGLDGWTAIWIYFGILPHLAPRDEFSFSLWWWPCSLPLSLAEIENHMLWNLWTYSNGFWTIVSA